MTIWDDSFNISNILVSFINVSLKIYAKNKRLSIWKWFAVPDCLSV